MESRRPTLGIWKKAGGKAARRHLGRKSHRAGAKGLQAPLFPEPTLAPFSFIPKHFRHK